MSSLDILISSSWLENLGYAKRHSPLNYKDCIATIFPEDRSAFEEELHRSLNCESDRLEIEIRAYKATGGYVWVLVRGKAVAFDENGKAIRLIGALYDVTLRKKQRKKIYT